MKYVCNKFEDGSCRFYALPEAGQRVKVHCDSEPDFGAVVKAFAAEKIKVTVKQLEAAYDAGVKTWQ
jgi:hypothetical protein